MYNAYFDYFDQLCDKKLDENIYDRITIDSKKLAKEIPFIQFISDASLIRKYVHIDKKVVQSTLIYCKNHCYGSVMKAMKAPKHSLFSYQFQTDIIENEQVTNKFIYDIETRQELEPYIVKRTLLNENLHGDRIISRANYIQNKRDSKRIKNIIEALVQETFDDFIPVFGYILSQIANTKRGYNVLTTEPVSTILPEVVRECILDTKNYLINLYMIPDSIFAINAFMLNYDKIIKLHVTNPQCSIIIVRLNEIIVVPRFIYTRVESFYDFIDIYSCFIESDIRKLQNPAIKALRKEFEKQYNIAFNIISPKSFGNRIAIQEKLITAKKIIAC
jgi:hypothetical protein